MHKIDQIYIYPTDTVWGIGCDINSELGFNEIARIKKTDNSKPLSIMFTSITEIKEYVDLPEILIKNNAKLFSMETTLLVPKKYLTNKYPSYLTSKSEFVSIRLMTLPLILELRKKIGAPFFTTSLNISGENPILEFNGASEFLKLHAPLALLHFDSNSMQNLSGTSSTIIKFDLSGSATILRPGTFAKEINFYLEELNLL